MKKGRAEKRKKMSQEIHLCEDSDDDNIGERPNSALIPSLPLTRKRHPYKEASFNAAHLRDGNGPGNKAVTGSAEFVDHLELADDVQEFTIGVD
jgi:hypothetical protein